MTQEIDLGGDDEFSVGDTVRFPSLFGGELVGTVTTVREDKLIIEPYPNAPVRYAQRPSEVVKHT